MNNPRLLQIANRINLLLLRELGQGVDIRRLIGKPLYARDVLLVCDALPGSDLASLAQHFRVARNESNDEYGSSPGFDSGGFGVSRPLPDADFGVELLPPPTARRWFSPARWIGR